jgi:hypothetical protein
VSRPSPFTLEEACYDETAGWIYTPGGPGKFVLYDPTRQVVVVEVDYSHLVEYPASECFLR